MKTGAALLAWARAEYVAWWDTRHDPNREPADQFLARIYLRGAIDALKEETDRKRSQVGPRPAQQPAAIPTGNRPPGSPCK